MVVVVVVPVIVIAQRGLQRLSLAARGGEEGVAQKKGCDVVALSGGSRRALWAALEFLVLVLVLVLV